MGSHHFVGGISCLVLIAGLLSVLLSLQAAQAGPTYTFTLTGSAGGVVTSSPAGINCGSDCQENFPDGSTITLTATTTDPAKQFVSWSSNSGQACNESAGISYSGTTCSYTIGFRPSGNYLMATWLYGTIVTNITKSGSGSGTVTGTGVGCGGDCSHSLGRGQGYTFTAAPAADSVFVGWETSGTICDLVGKGADALNTSATCTGTVNGVSASETAVARFDKKAVAVTSPTPTATTTPRTTTSTPTATSPAQTPQAAKPTEPTLAAVTVAGETVDAQKPIMVPANKPLVLSGKTVPNGIVKLYIFSEPKTADVTADKDGNWSYEVKDLPAGDHHVEAEITDPTTNKTSERKNVLAFTVAAAAEAPQNPATPTTRSDTPWYIGVIGGFALLGLAGGGFYYWWRKHKHTPNGTSNVPPTTPQNPVV